MYYTWTHLWSGDKTKRRENISLCDGYCHFNGLLLVDDTHNRKRSVCMIHISAAHVISKIGILFSTSSLKFKWLVFFFFFFSLMKKLYMYIRMHDFLIQQFVVLHSHFTNTRRYECKSTNLICPDLFLDGCIVTS